MTTRDAPDRDGTGDDRAREKDRTGVSPRPPAAGEGRRRTPRKRGASRGRVLDGGGYFDGSGAAALTGQWLRWPAGEDRPPWPGGCGARVVTIW